MCCSYAHTQFRNKMTTENEEYIWVVKGKKTGNDVVDDNTVLC